MKKILLIILLFAGLITKAQFPNTVTGGNSSTLNKQLGAYGANLGYVWTAAYSDTIAANLSFIKNVPGIVIRIGNDLWMRSANVLVWIKISGGGAGNRFGKSGEDVRFGEDRTPSGIGTYGLMIDSLANYWVGFKTSSGKTLTFFDYETSKTRFEIDNLKSGMYSPNQATNFRVFDDTAFLALQSTASKLLITNLASGATTDSVMMWNATTNRVGYKSVSSIDTHFGNTNLTQTANRTYSGATFSYTLNNLGHWSFNMATGKSFSVNNASSFIFNSTTNDWQINGKSGANDGVYIQGDDASNSILISAGTNTLHRSDIVVSFDSISIRPVNSIINIDSLTVGASSDSVMVWNKTTGRVGYISANSLGSGLIYNESVVKSNDSVYLRNEKVNPPVSNSVYTDAGFLPYVNINLTDPEEGDLLAYSGGEFKNVRRFNKMKFTAGQASYIAVGDSLLTGDEFLDKEIKIFRDGERQDDDNTVYGYEHLSDSIIFHPPLFTGEKIVIEIFDTLLWKSVDHIVPPSWTDLTFTTNTGLVNTSQVFTSTNAGFGNTGLDVLKLPAGQDGFIAIQYAAVDGVNAVIGFNTTNAEQTWGNFEAGIDIAGGDIYRIDGGGIAVTSCTGISTGDWVAINRTGSTLKLVRKSGALSSTLSDWTVCYTFSASSSADLFIGCDLFTAGSAKMYYPQGFNVQ